jgi:hypothetical protein
MFNNWLTFSTSVFSDARKDLSMVIAQMELLSGRKLMLELDF